MSKHLDVNEMLSAASEVDLPNLDAHVNALESAATDLARALAKHLRIEVKENAEFLDGFGGLCASFGPARKGQKCPKVIDEGDEGGDWE